MRRRERSAAGIVRGRDVMEFLARTEAVIAEWHGVAEPNPQARRFLADLAATIAAFEAIRDGMAFEDEPSDFDVALRETGV
jgi:hypothetical protein